MSIAGEAAAEARRRAAATPGYYNLKLGPTTWTLSAGLGTEFNDNVDYRDVEPDADVIFRPEANARMLWPVTDKNTLNFAVGLGYAKYVCRSDLDRVFVTPGSELSFDLYVKDFLINLHDRFSITENAYANPGVVGRGDYSRLENVAGVAVTWDLHDILVTLGYDHADYVSLNDAWRDVDGRTDVGFVRAGFAINDQSLIGLEGGGGWIDYNEPLLSDAIQYGGGGFYRVQISQYLNLSLRAGYTVYSPEAGGTIGLTEDEGAFYGRAALEHRVNKAISYVLSGGRVIQTGVQAGLYNQNLDYYFLRWTANWNFIRQMNLGTGFLFEDGTQVGGVSEDFTRWGVQLTLSRSITQKLTASLGYRFLYRDSDQPLRDYTVNSIFLNCLYRF